MKPAGFALSIGVFLAVLADSLATDKNMAYIAILAVVPLFYGCWRKNPAIASLFSPIIIFPYLVCSFYYPWNLISVLKLSIIWPSIFASHVLLSAPHSPILEKRVFFVVAATAAVSVLIIVLLPPFITLIKDPVVLALTGMAAAGAAVYIAWK